MKAFLTLLFFMALSTSAMAESITFLSIGDTRSNHRDHAAVVEAMLPHAQDASFYLHSGDMVGDGSSRTQWDQWFAIEAPLMSLMQIVPAVGNHDGYRDQSNGFEITFGVNTYHAWSYVNQSVLVLSLDTHVAINSDGSFNDGQMSWLVENLGQCQSYLMCIVQVHVGPYGAAEGRRGSPQMRSLLPVFEENGVDLILSGHDHLYERGYTENGLRYMTSAGGGAPLYAPRHDRGTQGNTVEYVEGRHHFLRFDLDTDRAEVRVQAIDVTGMVFDEFTLDLVETQDRVCY